jgi:hypothetical protein
MTAWAITTANTPLEFETQNLWYSSCFSIDANHFINFYTWFSSDWFAQVFEVNTTTWAVTTANASLEFDTNNWTYNSCYQIDSNHFINFWSWLDNDWYTQVFEVNTSTWAVTTANTTLEFDTTLGQYNSCYQVDTNHFINFFYGGAILGYVQVFTVNTTTWAVTTANGSLNFDTQSWKYHSCYQIDSNHFINFWSWTGDKWYTQVFEVNTSTWAVTTANTTLEFDTTYASDNSCYQIDGNHFINFWTWLDGYVQVFTVNTTTWAVTTSNARLGFDTTLGTYNSCYQIDSNHFINFWAGSGNDGYVQIFTVNTSTWAVTTANASLEFDTNNWTYNSCYKIDTNHFINFWTWLDVDWYTQVFTVELEPTTSIKSINWLAYASIKSVNWLALASVKSFNWLA